MMPRVRINTSYWVTAGHRRRSVSFWPGHPHWQTQRPRPWPWPTVDQRREKKNGSGPHFVASCSMPLLERISRDPSGTTLSWQCSLSTTNAMYESLGLCHFFLFSGLVEYYFPREGSKYTHTHNTHTQHTHTHTGTGGYWIGSIICRFLESKMRYRWQRLHRLFYRFLE